MSDAVRSRPIVVTGCPRSGTTWVGSTVGASSEVLYLYEPFNDGAPHHLDVPERYLYVAPDSPAHAVPDMSALIGMGGLGGRARATARGIRLGRRFRSELPAHLALHEVVRSPASALTARRTLVKDPLAFFAAEWLEARFDALVVMMVRHPAGMISSYLKLGWPCEVDSLLRQDGLRERFTEPLAVEIERYHEEPDDRLGGLILQWKIFAHAAARLREEHPEWLYMSHENVCEEPVPQFRALFEYLGLRWTPALERKVVADSTASQVDPARHQQHALQRDSRTLAAAWRARLSEADADRIENEAGPLWEQLSALAWEPRQRLPQAG
ncbi:sulfotransferase [Demequina activiva]|uniref:Sulfotransferase family protein n=1 Tax=Demequina activiva TaxID=1582364 RepID=A0A919PZ92_9MICO|nr:sulfotransferase [Demequina activiva]GIG53430.1 sulfotransferase family protein [Demequina activiva]